MDRIEELLETPYWIIDILPKQVPENSPGQYFAVEEYFLNTKSYEIKERHLSLILKLNCYYDLILDTEVNPSPAYIAEYIHGKHAAILLEDAMIVSKPDETYLTVYHPDESLLELLSVLVKGEGLYLWKGAQ